MIIVLREKTSLYSSLYINNTHDDLYYKLRFLFYILLVLYIYAFLSTLFPNFCSIFFEGNYKEKEYHIRFI